MNVSKVSFKGVKQAVLEATQKTKKLFGIKSDNLAPLSEDVVKLSKVSAEDSKIYAGLIEQSKGASVINVEDWAKSYNELKKAHPDVEHEKLAKYAMMDALRDLHKQDASNITRARQLKNAAYDLLVDEIPVRDILSGNQTRPSTTPVDTLKSVARRLHNGGYGTKLGKEKSAARFKTGIEEYQQERAVSKAKKSAGFKVSEQ